MLRYFLSIHPKAAGLAMESAFAVHGYRSLWRLRWFRSFLVSVSTLFIAVESNADERCPEPWLPTGEDGKPVNERITIRSHYINCLESEISELSGKKRQTKKTEKAVIKLRQRLIYAEDAQKKDRNTRNFQGGSVFLGAAVLQELGPGNSKDWVPMIGFQAVQPLKGTDTFAVGPFLAFNLSSIDSSAENDELKPFDYVAVGAAFSARFKDAAHPINFGVGYVVDRAGFMEKTAMGDLQYKDRSGLVIMVTFNPVASIAPASGLFLDALKKIPVPGS